MYRVCTYPDPFNIKSNSELWRLMTTSPHFCASQTLVQGLHTHYQKSSFYFMQPLQTLIDNVFFEWNNNFDNDIKLFLAVSDYIKNIKNETLKNAFKFNISEIVEGVRLLLVMRASSDMFDCENLTFEQVKEDLIERDRRDSFRDLSPLVLTEGVIHIDNSNMTIDEEVDLMIRTIKGEN